MMTVEELINELRQYPKDAPVLLLDGGKQIMYVEFRPHNDVVSEMVWLQTD